MEHLHCKVILLWCQQCRNPDLEVAFRCRKSWEGFWSVSAWISVRQKKSPTEIQSVRSSSSASSLLGADKGLKQTNFPFVPLLFLWGESPRAAPYFTNPFVGHKNQIHYLVHNTNDHTLKETLLLTSGLCKPGCSQLFHKSSTQTTKTCQFLHILANEGISVH